ncbi:MAG: acetate--CoA ligase family protein [Candidatus Thorarchaeota archaeon]
MHSIIDTAISEQRFTLTLKESLEFIQSYKIPANPSYLLSSSVDLDSVIPKLTFPVVIKIISPDIIHKTEVGGVVLNIVSPEDLKISYLSLIDRMNKLPFQPQIIGISVENQIGSDFEVILGTFNDTTFGQTIMFGVGGIFVEIINDVTFHLLPISEFDAREMIYELKSTFLLKGFRGKPPLNLDELVSIMMNLSKIVQENPIKEIDLNPILVFNSHLTVVDARIVLQE